MKKGNIDEKIYKMDELSAIIKIVESATYNSPFNPMFFKEALLRNLRQRLKNKKYYIKNLIRISDEAKNKEIANSLNQLKAMGAVIKIQDFNLGDILNRIEISAGPDHVRIYASFPEDLPNNLIDKFTKKEKKKKELKKK